MRPVPIPDGVAEALGGVRTVIGESDPTRLDVRPAEYVVTPSELYEGRAAFSALVELDEDDVALIRAGSRHVILTLDGAEVPWSLGVVPPSSLVRQLVDDGG